MGAEKNVDVVGVEDLAQVLLKIFNVHLWRDGEGLHEEHGVLELN